MKLFRAKWFRNPLRLRFTGTTESSERVGKPPGHLIYMGERKTAKTTFDVHDYTADSIEQFDVLNPEDCVPYISNNHKSWINIVGIDHVDTMARIGELFDLDELMLEDILDTSSRPKFEQFEKYVFVEMKMLQLVNGDKGYGISEEQLSLVLGNGWLLSFQEEEGDVFKEIRTRMHMEHSKMRQRGLDYLFYRLIDTVVDHYFVVVEHIGDEIEELELSLEDDLDERIRWRIQAVRKDLIFLRKAITPLREYVSMLTKEDTGFIKKETSRYFRDVYEHVVQLADYVDTNRDMVMGLLDLYHTGVSNRMNQIMKVLTIISTIFIPLTFIAGIYGMNFDHMPELHNENGYFISLGVMGTIVVLMIIYFKRKGWI